MSKIYSLDESGGTDAHTPNRRMWRLSKAPRIRLDKNHMTQDQGERGFEVCLASFQVVQRCCRFMCSGIVM